MTEAEQAAALGARVRSLRLTAGLSQREVAERAGMHRPNVARLEAGRNAGQGRRQGLPTLRIVVAVARALGVSASALVSVLDDDAR